jgi:ribulose 1,5-bisphosphate synthetase/thiazole synthase
MTQKGTLALKANRTLRRFNSTLNSIEDHDIISIGGGPVGLALAAALGKSCQIK